MPKELFPLGANPDPEDPKRILFRSLVTSSMAIDLPKSYSVRNDLWFKAYRQKYGSCTAGEGKYGIQYYRWKWYGTKEEVSPRFIYGRNKELDGQPDDEGSWPYCTMGTIFGAGSPKAARWTDTTPPKGSHADYIASPPQDIREEAIEFALPEGGYVRILNKQELKQAIYLYGPVGVSLTVYDTYDDVGEDGRIKPATGPSRGRHRNWATGWNEFNEIEVMNQWGEGWGDEGFGYIPDNYDPYQNFPLMDMQGITRDVNAQLTSGAPIELGYPVETPNPYVTQKFGARPEYYAKYGMKGHNGVDFRTVGTSRYIIAAADGEVISLNPSDGSYGKAVRLKHSWGSSIYAHNSQFLINALGNDGRPRKVKRGERIAIAGSTGDSSAEHCHFAIRINGVKNPGFFDWVDPTPYFKENTMTKFFRVQQGGTLGILVVEGFGGSLLWADTWARYLKLLEISGMTQSSPLILLPAGQTKIRVQDGQKAGILLLGGSNGGTLIYENDWTEYLALLELYGMTMQNPLINIPS